MTLSVLKSCRKKTKLAISSYKHLANLFIRSTADTHLQSIIQSINTNHLHKNDQWLTNKVKNNKIKIKPNE